MIAELDELALPDSLHFLLDDLSDGLDTSKETEVGEYEQYQKRPGTICV